MLSAVLVVSQNSYVSSISQWEWYPSWYLFTSSSAGNLSQATRKQFVTPLTVWLFSVLDPYAAGAVSKDDEEIAG